MSILFGCKTRALTTALALVFGILLACAPYRDANAQTPWAFAGSDHYDSHATYTDSNASQLSPANASKLKMKWSFKTNGSVQATPTVEPGGVYVPDTSGYIYKINPTNGALVWSQKLSNYTGVSGTWSRTSPAISGNTIVIGNGNAPQVIAINKTTGALLWKTTMNSYKYGIITAAPVIWYNVVYVGVASTEEAITTSGYVPVARGSVAALSLATGKIIWQFTTVPAGYTGGGVWGSSPVVDPGRNQVIVGTGDNYTLPSNLSACVKAAGTNKTAQLACVDPTNYVDAIIALDINTGKLNWSRRLGGEDAWNGFCYPTPKPGCPSPEGADSDFSSAPNMIWLKGFTGKADDRGGTAANYILGAGEKGGMYWALNPADGGLFWSRYVGAGDLLWGQAAGNLWTDTYFLTASDDQFATNTLAGQVGQGTQKWLGGYYSAIQAGTGKIIWQVPAGPKDLVKSGVGASAPGSLSFTNGLVFGGDTGGNLFAIDARSGFKFWTYNVGVTVKSSPAIFNNQLFWGVGYQNGVPGDHVYCFSVGGV